MTGHKPNIFWFLCWKYFAPAVMIGVFIFYIISFKAVKLGDYSYPPWAEGLGLCFSFASMFWVPAYAIYYLLTQPGTLMQVGGRGETCYPTPRLLLNTLLLLPLIRQSVFFLAFHLILLRS